VKVKVSQVIHTHTHHIIKLKLVVFTVLAGTVSFVKVQNALTLRRCSKQWKKSLTFSAKV
jgi:hypothetical protein